MGSPDSQALTDAIAATLLSAVHRKRAFPTGSPRNYALMLRMFEHKVRAARYRLRAVQDR
jgi:hypothetical protein